MNKKEKAVLAKNLFRECTDSEIEEAVKKGWAHRSGNVVIFGCNVPTKTYKYVTRTVCDRPVKETLNNNTGDKISSEQKPD